MKHLLILLSFFGCATVSPKVEQYAPNNFLVKVEDSNQFNIVQGANVYKEGWVNVVSFSGYDKLNGKNFTTFYSSTSNEMKIDVCNLNDCERIVVSEDGYKFIGPNLGYDYGPLITYSENVLNFVLG